MIFETCYLHIGGQKTGSTSIQKTLASNAAVLQQTGFHYPTIAANHAPLLIAAKPESFRSIAWQRRASQAGAETPTVEQLQADFRAAVLQEAQAADARRLILSSEVFSGSSEEHLRDMRSWLLGFCERIVVVAYVRHPASLTVSKVQQRLKGGTSLDQFNPNAEGTAYRELEACRNVYGRESMVLRDFDRALLHRGDVVRDFLKVIGISDADADIFSTHIHNESLSQEGALLADAIARLYDSATAEEKLESRLLYAKDLNSKLMRIRGSKFALDAAQSAIVREATAAEAARLRRDFGLALPEPHLPEIGEMWQPETVDDIARLIHDLSLENAKLRQKVVKLRAARKSAKDRPARSGDGGYAAMRRKAAKTRKPAPATDELDQIPADTAVGE